MGDSLQPQTPSRHEKSLGLLTTKFVTLLQEAKDGVLDLKAVSTRWTLHVHHHHHHHLHAFSIALAACCHFSFYYVTCGNTHAKFGCFMLKQRRKVVKAAFRRNGGRGLRARPLFQLPRLLISCKVVPRLLNRASKLTGWACNVNTVGTAKHLVFMAVFEKRNIRARLKSETKAFKTSTCSRVCARGWFRPDASFLWDVNLMRCFSGVKIEYNTFEIIYKMFLIVYTLKQPNMTVHGG